MLTVIALPHAGGASFNYHPIRQRMPRGVNFVAADLPGHGARMAEPLLTSIGDMADDIVRRYRDHMRGDYVLFGHSMGASLAYEICCRLDSAGGRLPELLAVSGRQGPSVENTVYCADLPSSEFTEMLVSLGGIPAELSGNREVLAMFEAIFRADFRAIESYRPSLDRRLHVPVTVMCGRDDAITMAELETWAEVTDKNAEIRMFPGGHFYLFDHAGEVAELLTRTASTVKTAAIAA